MSKKKKVQSGVESDSKSKNINLKDINKSIKSKLQKSGGISKIKNKQKVKDVILSKSKSKQNVKDNRKSNFKDKPKIQSNHKLNSNNQQSPSPSASPKVGKNKNNLLKKLNISKINALLSIKQAEEKIKKPKSSLSKKPATTLSLKERMIAQLKSSRFRFLNEQMYSTESSASQKYFQEDPNAFYAYHEGYKQQVERWPVNPLDVIIESINKM